MFCDNCGAKLEIDHKFCDSCGKLVIDEEGANDLPRENFFSIEKLKTGFHQLSKKRILTTMILIMFIVLGYGGYKLYSQYQNIENALRNSTQELQSTQDALSNLEASTTRELASVSSTPSNKKSIEKSVLAKTLGDNSNGNNQAAISGSQLLTKIAPAVVKVVCSADASPDGFQQGSGLLFSTDSGYSVQTNLHVIETSDGSTIMCWVALYPNPQYANYYLLFKGINYKYINEGVDIAYIVLGLADGSHAGSFSDLATYALSKSQTSNCANSSLGDHLTVLGYPAVGGATLTITDGIISGFEYDNGARYIKTSAKIDQGSSGGIAIEESGCLLGIPTFVEQGQLESIGRILDLKSLSSISY